MAYKSIQIDMFADEVNKILKTYANTTAEQMNEIADSVSKEALKQVRQNSPVRKGKNGGRYKKGWTRKADKKKAVNEYVIYNKDRPQLTFLLEKGHKVKPKPKRAEALTFVEGKEHIGPVEEWARQEMIRRAVDEL
jgi:hypothetical protein